MPTIDEILREGPLDIQDVSEIWAERVRQLTADLVVRDAKIMQQHRAILVLSQANVLLQEQVQSQTVSEIEGEKDGELSLLQGPEANDSGQTLQEGESLDQAPCKGYHEGSDSSG